MQLTIDTDFAMPEQRVKTINFDVCKTAAKLIGYNSNVPSITAELITGV